MATNRDALFSVEGTVAVITGGGLGGLGASMALSLDVRTEQSRCMIVYETNEANHTTNLLGQRSKGRLHPR